MTHTITGPLPEGLDELLRGADNPLLLAIADKLAGAAPPFEFTFDLPLPSRMEAAENWGATVRALVFAETEQVFAASDEERDSWGRAAELLALLAKEWEAAWQTARQVEHQRPS